MKKLLLVLVGSIVLSGCRTVSSYARGMSQLLGVPVTLETSVEEDDYCLQLQLSNWKEQYDALGSEARNELRTRVGSELDSIVLGATSYTGRLVRRRLVKVQYGGEHFNPGLGDDAPSWDWFTKEEKAVVKETIPLSEGIDPGPRRAVTDRALRLGFIHSRAEFEFKVYRTESKEVFDAVDSGQAIRDSSGLYLGPYDLRDRQQSCGELIDLASVVEDPQFFNK